MKNVRDHKFITEGQTLLKQKKEILTLVYYHLGGGSRNFRFIRTENQLDTLINQLSPYDELTLFKSINVLYRGSLSLGLLKDIKNDLRRCDSGDWLIVWENGENDEWNFFDSIEELCEDLRTQIGREITILCEPDWNFEEGIIRGYSPDSNGEVVKGKY